MFSTFITFLRLRYKRTTLLHHTQDIHSGDFKVHFPFTFVYKNIFFKTCGHFLTRHFSGIGWRPAFGSPFMLKSKWHIILTGPTGSRTDHETAETFTAFQPYQGEAIWNHRLPAQSHVSTSGSAEKMPECLRGPGKDPIMTLHPQFPRSGPPPKSREPQGLL